MAELPPHRPVPGLDRPGAADAGLPPVVRLVVSPPAAASEPDPAAVAPIVQAGLPVPKAAPVRPRRWPALLSLLLHAGIAIAAVMLRPSEQAAAGGEEAIVVEFVPPGDSDADRIAAAGPSAPPDATPAEILPVTPPGPVAETTVPEAVVASAPVPEPVPVLEPEPAPEPVPVLEPEPDLKPEPVAPPETVTAAVPEPEPAPVEPAAAEPTAAVTPEAPPPPEPGPVEPPPPAPAAVEAAAPAEPLPAPVAEVRAAEPPPAEPPPPEPQPDPKPAVVEPPPPPPEPKPTVAETPPDPALSTVIAEPKPVVRPVPKPAVPAVPDVRKAPPKAPQRTTAKAPEKPATARGQATGKPDSRDAADSRAGGAALRGSGVEGAAVLASYKAQVLAHLIRHKRYPDAARERGTEGRVPVAFVVARDGRLVSAELVGSSGSPDLDRATLDTVRRAAPYPQAPDGAPATATFRTLVRYDLR
ncbi:TonB family protein [Prosthecomicrobium hirschii]|uniref:TonB family protein n=1 Tax=Prosthecodimorpha hirschii TaxID=665126 RepID=UPI0022203592|nr:TonB family protein [Prosthecomicrobium hirschii]MCW1842568.1 TonB family protein [Prosthecomicrobium hirschii]